MGNKHIRGYTLIALVFVIYIAATTPFDKTAVFWIAFSFSLLAFLGQVYTVHDIMRKQVLIKDRIYDFPQIRISALYLAVQFLTSLLLMGFSLKIPVFVAVIVETVILAVAVLGFFSVETVRAQAIRQNIRAEKKLAKMEELQTRVNLLASRCDGEQIGRIVQRLAEEVRYSNPASGDDMEEIEDEIMILFEETEIAALEEDVENTEKLCGKIMGLLKERDRFCKHSHH